MQIYDTEEQQLEAIKNWWAKNAMSILAGLAIGGALVAGYKFWKNHQEEQAILASTQYDTVRQLVIDKSALTSIEPAAQSLVAAHQGSGYAVMTQLLLAKSYVDNKQYDKAIEQLQQAKSNNTDEILDKIIRLRLARLLNLQGQYDQALALLTIDSLKGYERIAHDLTGDILLNQGQIAQARTAYQQALDVNPNLPDSLIQTKLNNIPSE